MYRADTLTSRSLWAWTIIAAGGLLALTMRWYFVTHAQVLQPLDDPNVQADAADYYRYAWNVFHHGTFASDLPGATMLHPSSFRDPGYALFLAAWMAITSSYPAWYAGVVLSQAALGALTVVLILVALRGTVSNLTLGCAALLMACWPHSVAAPAYVLTETLFGFLCASSVLALRCVTDRQHPAWLVSAALLLSLTSLANAVLIPFAPLLAGILFLRKRLDARRALLLALISLLLPAAWGLRSSVIPVTGTSTHRAAMNLVQGSWPTYHDAYQLAMKGNPAGKQTIQAIDAEIARFDQGPHAGLARMLDRMSGAPGTYLAWYLSKPAVLWGWDIRIGQGDIYVYPTRQSPFATLPAWKSMESLYFLANPLLAIFSAIGAVYALTRKNAPSTHLAMAAIVAFATLVYGVLQSEPRYATPFRGFEAALACIAIEAARSFWRRRTDTRHGLQNVSA